MRGVLVLSALLLLAMAALFAARRERARERAGPERAVGPEPALGVPRPLDEADLGATHESIRVEAEATPADHQLTLRVRVIESAQRTTLPDAGVCLDHPSERVPDGVELPDGVHEFAGEIPPGTEVVVSAPDGWEIASDRIEIDAVPEDELVVVADAVPMGAVHGVVVDELEGHPLPFQRLDVDGEDLVSDAAGEFHGAELHPRGTLRFRGGSWSYELGGWDPEEEQFVTIPVRAGPTIYLDPDRVPTSAMVRWMASGARDDAIAFGLEPPRDEIRTQTWTAKWDPEPVPRAQFPWGMPRPESGEIRVVSHADFLFGAARLDSNTGSLEDPLRITLRPCGVVVVLPRFSRALSPDEQRQIVFVLFDSQGRELAETALHTGQGAFAVLAPDELSLDVRLGGQALASTRVGARLLEIVPVYPDVTVPPCAEAEPDGDGDPEALHPVKAVVVSRKSRHHEARLSLVRQRDGRETTIGVDWTKRDGRWLGLAKGRAPAGAHRIQLEVEPAFAWDDRARTSFLTRASCASRSTIQRPWSTSTSCPWPPRTTVPS